MQFSKNYIFSKAKKKVLVSKKYLIGWSVFNTSITFELALNFFIKKFCFNLKSA